MALSRRTRNKVNEWLLWYNHHAEKIGTMPLEGQIKWLLKSTNGAYEMFSAIAQEMNGEVQPNEATRGIILPPGARW